MARTLFSAEKMLALPTPVRAALFFWLTITSAATTSDQVAGYVASGLGLSKETSTSTYKQNITSLRPSSYSNSSVTSAPVSERSTGTASQDTSTSLSNYVSTSTSQPAATGSNTTAYATTTGIPLTSGSLASSVNGSGGANGVFTNVTYDGDCWTQWNEYWNASYTVSLMVTDVTFTSTETVYTIYKETPTPSTETTTLTTTSTIFDGPYAVSATTITTIETLVDEDPAYSGTSTTAWPVVSASQLYPSGVVQPDCTLPSYIPACQSSWEDWAKLQYSTLGTEGLTACPVAYQTVYNTAACSSEEAVYSSQSSVLSAALAATTPGCSQATITGSICSALVSSYITLASVEYGLETWEAAGYQQTCLDTDCDDFTYYWPTSTQFAPGCSLGCQSCRITAGTVQLMYWPPATITYPNGTIRTAASNDSNAAVTTVLSGTTLTSPTVYISFDSLYASDSCSIVGSTRYGDIVPITDSADLSSLWGWNCPNGYQNTASFDLADLYVTPIPYSIYMSQPRCWSELRSAAIEYEIDQGWGDGSKKRRKMKRGPSLGAYDCGPTTAAPNWTCASTLPYLPIIALPVEVRELDPGWASCIGGLNGGYDPPKALQGASVAASVTTPVAGSSTILTSDAQPASSATPTVVKQTTTVSPARYSTSASASDPSLATPSTGSVETTTIVIVSPSTPTNVASSAKSSVTESTPSPPTTTATLTTSGDPDQSEAGTQSSESAAPKDPGSSATGNTPASSITDPVTSTTVSVLQQSDAGTQSSESAAASDPVTTNALSVLAQAESSYQSSTTGLQVDPTQSQSSEAAVQTSSQDTIATTTASEGAVFNGVTVAFSTLITSVNGGPVTQVVYSATSGAAVTVVQQGSSYVVSGGSGTVTLGAGQSVVVNGETIILPSNSQAASVTDGASSDSAQSFTTTENGHMITAVAGGSSLVLAETGSTTTVARAEATDLNGVPVSIVSGGQSLVYGETTIALGEPSGTTQQSVVLTQSGHTITAVLEGSSILIQEAGSSTLLQIGATQAPAGPTALTNTISSAQPAAFSTVLALGTDSITVSVDPNGHDIVNVGSTSFSLTPGGLVITVNSVILSEASNGALVAQSGSLTTTISDPQSTSDGISTEAVVTVGGHTFSAIVFSGSSIILEDATSTMTLSNGATATFEGQTVVAASGGTEVVVDGTSTVQLIASTPATSAVTVTQQPQSGSKSASDLAATTSSVSGGGHLVASLGMPLLFGMVACLI